MEIILTTFEHVDQVTVREGLQTVFLLKGLLKKRAQQHAWFFGFDALRIGIYLFQQHLENQRREIRFRQEFVDFGFEFHLVLNFNRMYLFTGR